MVHSIIVQWNEFDYLITRRRPPFERSKKKLSVFRPSALVPFEVPDLVFEFEVLGIQTQLADGVQVDLLALSPEVVALSGFQCLLTSRFTQFLDHSHYVILGAYPKYSFAVDGLW